jgi:hypothetical protein
MAKKKSVEAEVNQPSPETNFRYKFGAIQVVEYWGGGVSEFGITPGVITPLNLNFDVKMAFGLALDMNNANPAIVITPEITCTLQEDHTKKLCYLKITTYFPIEGLEPDELTREPHFPDVLLATLINLALGTARGILYAKNFGTPYASTIMPAMDLGSLIPKGPWLTPPNPIEVPY